MLGWWREAREKKTWLARVREYRGQVPVHFETGDFLVTAARDGADLLEALKLRHAVFIEEWQERRNDSGLDVDDFDFVADHLLIRDKRRDEVVGTYRLLHSRHARRFYSQTEFHVEQFLALKGEKLELGRACVALEYRDGNTIDLLWKGLARYIQKTGPRYLFGCASVRETDPVAVGGLIAALRQKGLWSDEFSIRPSPDYRLAGLAEVGAALPRDDYKQALPPLLRSYFQAGAKIYGAPAYDAEFDCIDLFTILDITQINPRYRSRFFAPETAGFVDLRPRLEVVREEDKSCAPA